MELSGGKGGRAFLGEPCACPGGRRFERAGWGWENARAWQDAKGCKDGDAAEGSKEQTCGQALERMSRESGS